MRNRYVIYFVVALLMQMVLSKYCQAGPYLLISILPAMILCQPTSRPSFAVVAAAFGCGLCVDFLADGTPGLNTAALLPTAILQKPVLKLAIDKDIVNRGYNFSIRQNGIFKVSGALLIETFIFLLIYIALDGMYILSFGRFVLKILISLVASLPFGLAVCSLLCPDTNS